RVLPRAAKVGGSILIVYVALTLLLALLLLLAGMSRFPALLHAMSAISCGGFSTSDGSIGQWHKPAVDWVILLGMLLGGAPFVIYLQLAQRRWRAVLCNSQLRWYGAILLSAGLLIGFWLYIVLDVKPLPAIRHGLFTVTSVMTGSGFATLDWTGWTGIPLAVLFFISFIGGCAGSTSGGIKLFRLQILVATARAQMARLMLPNAVLLPHYERQPIPDQLAESVLGFLFVYSLCFAFLAMGLGMAGLDFNSALSAAASALANLGPGFGPMVGPLGGFGQLPDLAKWLLTVGMLLGRLEMFILLVLFAPSFWKP
ncbi:MAG TPA: TrkH family potassium uptake protein, partial [Rhodospirillaceae bacterium]|nr:TrkH family potassium uptake protein [Rhodospirillaceae bacterium]